MKGAATITPDEMKFAVCFARTLSVKEAATFAAFPKRTAFALASRLLERDDVRSFIRAEILASSRVPAPDAKGNDLPADGGERMTPIIIGSTRITSANESDPPVSGVVPAPSDKADIPEDFGKEEERIIREYEQIAFADLSAGEVKVADKLRALDQYRAMIDRRASRSEGDVSLTVNYDYGD